MGSPSCWSLSSLYLWTAGVTLLLWGPPPPAQLQKPSKADTALAAQQAEAAYHQTFLELLEMPSALGVTQPALLLHSWGRFLARWMSAGKAAQGGQKGGQTGAIKVAGDLKDLDLCFHTCICVVQC